HVVDEEQVAVSLADATRLNDDVAEPWTWRDVDLDALDLLARVLGQQLLVRVQSRLALGLAGARRHANPLQLALQGPLAFGFRLLLERQSLLLLLEPGRVVAFP